MFDQLRHSSAQTKDAVESLRNLYNSTKAVVDMYPGKNAEQARMQLMQDLVRVNKHLAKVFNDSFVVKSGSDIPSVEDPAAFLAYLRDYPATIYHPAQRHTPTPLEIAIFHSDTDLAQQIITIAQEHKIKPMDLIDPLINEYKSLMNSKGETAAHAFVQKIYDIGNDTISKLLHRHLSKIDFSTK